MLEGLSDTSPEIEARMSALYAAMTPRQRVARALSLSQFTRQLTRAELRRRYPEASEDELKVRFAQRMLGDELALAVFGRIYGD